MIVHILIKIDVRHPYPSILNILTLFLIVNTVPAQQCIIDKSLEFIVYLDCQFIFQLEQFYYTTIIETYSSTTTRKAKIKSVTIIVVFQIIAKKEHL